MAKYTKETLVAAIDAGVITGDNLVALLTAGEITSDLASFAIKSLTDKASGSSLSLIVSPKGCVQMNGLRRFPASYYADEWKRILAYGPKILAFIEAHPELKGKKDVA